MSDFYIFAGINGAGKSTLYSNELIENNTLSKSKRINADEIARRNNWSWRKKGSNIKAMRIEISEIKYCLQNKQSFNLETTLSGSSKYFFNLITKAKNNGFKVHLYYVGLSSVYLALDRVKARVKKGGHGVDENLIYSRYPNSLKNLYELIDKFDEVKVYDNSLFFSRIYWRDGSVELEKANDIPDWFKPAFL